MKHWDFSKPLAFCAALVFVFGIILVVSGCSDTEREEDAGLEVSERIEAVETSKVGNGSLVILVDKETGVHYLWCQSGYKGGLTTMYNADGTIYTGNSQ